MTENWHVDGVLSAPRAGGCDAQLERTAFGYARALAERLDYVGVFALELFCRGGQLLANELAPRVHNSGHWTVEGAETSQFQNHLRAVLGLPLGGTAMRGHACMLNWVGHLPDADAVLAEPGGHGTTRQSAARRRKVGHATLRADSTPRLPGLVRRRAPRPAAPVAPFVARLAGDPAGGQCRPATQAVSAQAKRRTP